MCAGVGGVGRACCLPFAVLPHLVLDHLRLLDDLARELLRNVWDLLGNAWCLLGNVLGIR